jgi:hypothetical protein
MKTTTDKLAEALRAMLNPQNFRADPSAETLRKRDDAINRAHRALAAYDAEKQAAPSIVEALRDVNAALDNVVTGYGAHMTREDLRTRRALVDETEALLAAYDANKGAMVYTLAELRNGTGFPKGARFVMVGAGKPVAPSDPVAAIRAYNDKLNAAERAPTGDDYNALLDIVGVR